MLYKMQETVALCIFKKPEKNILDNWNIYKGSSIRSEDVLFEIKKHQERETSIKNINDRFITYYLFLSKKEKEDGAYV